jgi:hypothetical protein
MDSYKRLYAALETLSEAQRNKVTCTISAALPTAKSCVSSSRMLVIRPMFANVVS